MARKPRGRSKFLTFQGKDDKTIKRYQYTRTSDVQPSLTTLKVTCYIAPIGDNLKATVQAIKASGITTLGDIAKALQARGIKKRYDVA